MFAKAVVKWGEDAVKVYDANDYGETAELIDDTNLASTNKEYVASDLHDSDEISLQVQESDAAKFVVGTTKVVTITYDAATGKTPSTFSAIVSKRAALALKRGDRMIREITLKPILPVVVAP